MNWAMRRPDGGIQSRRTKKCEAGGWQDQYSLACFHRKKSTPPACSSLEMESFRAHYVVALGTETPQLLAMSVPLLTTSAPPPVCLNSIHGDMINPANILGPPTSYSSCFPSG